MHETPYNAQNYISLHKPFVRNVKEENLQSSFDKGAQSGKVLTLPVTLFLKLLFEEATSNNNISTILFQTFKWQFRTIY